MSVPPQMLLQLIARAPEQVARMLANKADAPMLPGLPMNAAESLYQPMSEQPQGPAVGAALTPQGPPGGAPGGSPEIEAFLTALGSIRAPEPPRTNVPYAPAPPAPFGHQVQGGLGLQDLLRLIQSNPQSQASLGALLAGRG